MIPDPRKREYIVNKKALIHDLTEGLLSELDSCADINEIPKYENDNENQQYKVVISCIYYDEDGDITSGSFYIERI